MIRFNLLLTRLVFRTKSGPLAYALKKVFRFKRTTVKTPHGIFAVDPFSHFGFFILRDGEYEPGLADLLERRLSPGSILVDVGAHEGYFAVLAARIVGSSGKVLAIEPQSRVLPVLQENLRLNDASNVIVVPYAISDKTGSEELFLSVDHNTGGSGLTKTSRFNLPTERVTTRSLIDVVDRHGIDNVDLIKMDIEGFEYEAILGSTQLFRNKRVGTIALELHGAQIRSRGRDPHDIERFLRECDYGLNMVESSNLGTDHATMVFDG